MKIVYRGPRDSVNVPPYGEHRKDEAKDYPDKFGQELLKTSKKQQFEVVRGPKEPDKKKAVIEEKPPPAEETPEG